MIRQSAAVTFRPELSNRAYHEILSHDSNSSLRLFDKSPSKYHAIRIAKTITPKPQTEEQKIGDATHTVVLQPELIEQTLIKIPAEVLAKNGARSTNEYYAWSAENAGKTQLKAAEYCEVLKMVEAVQRSIVARESNLKRCTDFELSIFDAQTKARFDGIATVDAFFLDLKSHRWESEGEFWKSVREYSYHCQAALYSDIFEAAYGIKPVAKWLLVQNEPPYDVLVRTVPQWMIEWGRSENQRVLDELNRRREANNWNPEGYDVERDLDCPEHFGPRRATAYQEAGPRHEY